MPEPSRTIFRNNAVQAYLQGRQETVLPRFVSPRTFLFLWALLALLVAGGFMAWLTEVPVYASGPAVIVEGKATRGAVRGEAAVLILIPAEERERLRAGQRMFLRMGERERRISPIVAVAAEVLSPVEVQKRYGLAPAASQAVTRPTIVAIAPLQTEQGGLPAAAQVGSVYSAEVEVGARRVLSFLPGINRVFGKQSE